MEDNPANLKLIEQLIARRPDMRLLSATDGTRGIQLARANQPEVILMDINLPGISGIEALRILREDPETAHIPVVALSANAMPRDIEKGLQAGFFRYLTKPIKVNEFMQTLDARNGIRERAMVSPAEILSARILVVDDQQANVSLLEGMLRIAGYTSVDSTTNPDEVCELHRQNRYSLILLDLQMPGMDGFQVMEGLKEIEQDGYLPVLVITAQPAHKLRALEAGAKDFVSKPFDLAELRARVHNILEVRLLHRGLEETVRELERSREVIRLKTLEEQREKRAGISLGGGDSGRACCPVACPSSRIIASTPLTRPRAMWAAISTTFCNWVREIGWACLADVSGKGMSAALVKFHGAGRAQHGVPLRDPTAGGAGPREPAALRKISARPVRHAFPFCRTPQGTGQFISAGHNPAYLFRAATGKIEKLFSDASFWGCSRKRPSNRVPFISIKETSWW